jgi:hypothetical protein
MTGIPVKGIGPLASLSNEKRDGPSVGSARSWNEMKALQRPLPNDALKIVTRGGAIEDLAAAA